MLECFYGNCLLLGLLFFSSSYNEVHDPVACFILYSVSHNFSILDCKSMQEFSITFAIDLKKDKKAKSTMLINNVAINAVLSE